MNTETIDRLFLELSQVTSAKTAREAELEVVIRKAVGDLEKIVCTKPPDDGVILLSSESPTEYDPIAKCQVYVHEHFSPLGDALIALHKRLAALTATGGTP